MSDADDLKKELAFIESYFAHALRHRFGESRPDPAVVQHALAESFAKLEVKVFGLFGSDDARAALAEVLTLDWLGIPEGFDATAVLARIPLVTLDWYYEHLGLGHWGVNDASVAGRLLWLEHAKRHGNITDWKCTRRSATEFDLALDLKEPIRYVSATFAVEPTP